jgi:hypothetical protein
MLLWQGERKVAQEREGWVSEPTAIAVFDRENAGSWADRTLGSSHSPDFAIALATMVAEFVVLS